MNRVSADKPDGPRELFARLHRAVRDDYDMDAQADLYAPDGVLELPFAGPEMPRRFEGREMIRRMLGPAGRRARAVGRRIVTYEGLTIHETADPEVIVAEFTLVGEVAGTGDTYRIPFIQVLRARDGQIVALRDYFNGQAMTEALGEAPLPPADSPA